MPSADGPRGPDDQQEDSAPAPAQTVELELFESLIHHLVEKGVLTKNDALSVVQTVAEVKRGEQEAQRRPGGIVRRELTVLERLYSSFDLMKDGIVVSQHAGNVLQLRPPLHGEKPRFPKDD